MAKQIDLMAYAKANVGDHYDSATGEVNATALGEDIANHFNLGLNDERPFEIAFKVAVAYEKRMKETK